MAERDLGAKNPFEGPFNICFTDPIYQAMSNELRRVDLSTFERNELSTDLLIREAEIITSPDPKLFVKRAWDALFS